MADTDQDTAGGLTGLDWVVIVAAAVSLILAITWLVQGRKPEPAAAVAE